MNDLVFVEKKRRRAAPLLLRKAAVVVIDVQTGVFRAKTPPFEADQVIEAINSLTERARAAEAPVFMVQHNGNREENLVRGSKGWRLDLALSVSASDIRMEKKTCDAFFDTELAGQLAALGVSTLVLAGYATEFCLDSTLRHAVSSQWEVVVAADAHTTNDSPVLKANLIRKQFNWAWQNCTSKTPIRVVPVHEIAFHSRGSASRKNR